MPKADDALKLRPAQREPVQIYKEKLDEMIVQNQELLAQNQELRAENKGLLAREQELSAKNRGLLAREQELSAENKGLLARNQELSTQYADFLAKERALVVRKPQELSVKGKAPAPFLTKAYWMWGGLLLAVVFALASAAYFYTRMEAFSDDYDHEYERRKEVEEELSEAQVAGEEAEKEINELREQAKAALSEARAAQEEASEAQAARKEAEDALSELHSSLSAAYGYASDSFYARESVMALHVGETKTLHACNKKSYTFASASNQEALKIGAFDAYDYWAEIGITARRAGVYTVRCAAYSDSSGELRYFQEAFNVLVVVTEQEGSAGFPGGGRLIGGSPL